MTRGPVRIAGRRCGIAVALVMVAAVPRARAQDVPDASGPAASCQDQRTMIAVAQALGINLVVNRIDAWVMDEEWARVGFESWGRNLRLGWEWDENAFDVNMFLHPYHGSLYFDAARANCLSFWESVPIAFLGSWTWEYFGETYRPSLNDFFMTGFGGVALGEMLHRISTGLIDEEARGGERLARELGALAINPLGGLNRLVRGQWRARGTNPSDRIPEVYGFVGKVGGRRIRESGEPVTYSPTLLLQVSFGDFFETEYEAPFDVVGVLAQVSPDGGGLNILRAVGRLYGTELSDPGAPNRHQLVIRQRFDYVSNPVYHFGEQSLEAGLLSRWSVGDTGFRLRTTVAGDVMMMGAIDAPDAGFGERTNDFGPGLGAVAEVALERGGRTYVSFYNRFRYLHSVSGAPAGHTLLFSGLDVSVPLTRRLGLGAYLSGDQRRSRYDTAPDDDRSYLETRVYLTWALAGRRESR